jgi:uncharacterized protein with NRDE domain
MCTVTFIPAKKMVFITSNRDEKPSRKQALPPSFYTVNGNRLLFPKDGHAGGTWIAMNENGNAAVLLNGALEKHISRPPYKKSRGVVFTEIISATIPSKHFSKMVLDGIEPFTLVLYENGRLFECRWDETKKHCRELSVEQKYIWSSATLYSKEVVQRREQWFRSFINSNEQPAQDEILNFHLFTGNGDKHNDLNMDRNGLMCTVSVTGIAIGNNSGKMVYKDLQNKKEYSNNFSLAALTEVNV